MHKDARFQGEKVVFYKHKTIYITAFIAFLSTEKQPCRRGGESGEEKREEERSGEEDTEGAGGVGGGEKKRDILLTDLKSESFQSFFMCSPRPL